MTTKTRTQYRTEGAVYFANAEFCFHSPTSVEEVIGTLPTIGTTFGYEEDSCRLEVVRFDTPEYSDVAVLKLRTVPDAQPCSASRASEVLKSVDWHLGGFLDGAVAGLREHTEHDDIEGSVSWDFPHHDFGEAEHRAALERAGVVLPSRAWRDRSQIAHCFGCCPDCGSPGIHLRVRRANWVHCEEHRTAWMIGENLFSEIAESHAELDERWRRNAERLKGYEEVSGSCFCVPGAEEDRPLPRQTVQGRG